MVVSDRPRTTGLRPNFWGLAEENKKYRYRMRESECLLKSDGVLVTDFRGCDLAVWIRLLKPAFGARSPNLKGWTVKVTRRSSMIYLRSISSTRIAFKRRGGHLRMPAISPSRLRLRMREGSSDGGGLLLK